MINSIIFWLLFYLTGCLLAYLLSIEIESLMYKLAKEDKDFEEMINDALKKNGTLRIKTIEIFMSWIIIIILIPTLLVLIALITLQYLLTKF